MHSRLSELGCRCLHPRVEVDSEDWGVIEKWMDEVLKRVVQLELPVSTDYLQLSLPEDDDGISRTNPFSSKMTVGGVTITN